MLKFTRVDTLNEPKMGRATSATHYIYSERDVWIKANVLLCQEETLIDRTARKLNQVEAV